VRWRTLARRGLAVRVRVIGAATIRARLALRRGRGWAAFARASRRVSTAGTFRVRVRARHGGRSRRAPTRVRISVWIARGAAEPVRLRATLRVVGAGR
jgi:hypothetical protein